MEDSKRLLEVKLEDEQRHQGSGIPLTPAPLRTPAEHAAVLAAAWQGVRPKRERRSRSRSTGRSSGSKGYPRAEWAKHISNNELTEMISAAADELKHRADHKRKR